MASKTGSMVRKNKGWQFIIQRPAPTIGLEYYAGGGEFTPHPLEAKIFRSLRSINDDRPDGLHDKGCKIVQIS